MPSTSLRSRRDLCPGVLRPWPADDGALVRVRLVGGRIAPAALGALGRIAATWGDGDLHLTGRANLQLRGLPDPVPVEAFETAGVLPSRSHELVRNVMVSPASGLAGGRADLRAVADELDRLLLADPALATLPGRFLFVLDDGRGDLVDRPLDLGLVAVDADHGQLRIGSHSWGSVLPLAEAPAYVVGLARAFLAARGDGPSAAWHVDELDTVLGTALAEPRPRDPRTVVAAEPLPHGEGPAGRHVAVPDGVLTPALLAELAAENGPLVVTPWHGVLVA